MQLFKKQKYFLSFLLHFWNLHEISNIVKIKVTLTPDVLPKMWTAKDVFIQTCKEPRFRTPFDSQQAKGSQTLLKSTPHHFYHIFSSLPEEWGCNMSPLVTCEILVLFLNTLTADDKYSLCNSKNWHQPIQMQLSKKQRNISAYFHQYMKCRWNVGIFWKNKDRRSFCIPWNMDS